MTTHTYHDDGNGFTPEEMERMQAQLDGMTPQQRATSHHFRPAGQVAHRSEVVMRNGQLVEHTSASKGATPTAYVNQPTPGMVSIGGMVTSVDAAKAAGILPPQWQEGDPLPFDKAPTRDSTSATAPADASADAPAGDKASTSDSGSDKGEGDKTSNSHAAHVAKLAGEILHGVQQVHGPQVTEGLLSEVADSGDPDAILDRLPQGVTETHVKQVMAGYVAQANHQLAAVGASVPMLEDLLGEDDLRAARLATLANNPEAMHDLGRKAVNALALLPEKDPQGFQEMVAAMAPKERECVRYDRNSREWRVTIPGQPEMSYGAAVRLGYVRV